MTAALLVTKRSATRLFPMESVRRSKTFRLDFLLGGFNYGISLVPEKRSEKRGDQVREFFEESHFFVIVICIDK